MSVEGTAEEDLLDPLEGGWSVGGISICGEPLRETMRQLQEVSGTWY